jgi:hypothetical protein
VVAADAFVDLLQDVLAFLSHPFSEENRMHLIRVP